MHQNKLECFIPAGLVLVVWSELALGITHKCYNSSTDGLYNNIGTNEQETKLV